MAEKVHILGAGIVGICSALSLLERGYAVELIDRSAPGSGASSGNAGVVSPWSCIPQSMPGVWKKIPAWLLKSDGPLTVRWRYLPAVVPWFVRFLQAGSLDKLPQIADAMNALNRPNVDLYTAHLRGTGSEDLLARSLYVHAFKDPRKADLNALNWRMRAERNVPLEHVTGGALQEIEPELSSEYRAAVLLKGQARARDPGALAEALAQKAVMMGATFTRAITYSLKPVEGGRWALDTDTGLIVAEKLLIAAGAWSGKLLEPLGMRLPLEAERGYHLMFSSPGITVNNSVMDGENLFVASSMLDGIRCAGTAEFAGLNTPPNYQRAHIFKDLAKQLFPNLQTEETHEWMGSRPSFPDSLPCIGQVPGKPRLFAAFGHSHYGFGMAPGTGRLIAEIIAGATPSTDSTPYRIARFL